MHGFGNDDDMWPRSTGNFFFHRRFDTVIMNPPFGTRRKGADLDFLLRAIEVSARMRLVLHSLMVLFPSIVVGLSTRFLSRRLARSEQYPLLVFLPTLSLIVICSLTSAFFGFPTTHSLV